MDSLHKFAEIANETTGCSFTITRGRDRLWKITFPNIYDQENKVCKSFSHSLLDMALLNATDYIKIERKTKETVPVRYTIYDNQNDGSNEAE